MSITDLSSPLAATLGLVQGTGETMIQSVTNVVTQGQEQTQTLASQVGQGMSQLQQLAASDPTRFASVAQTIARQLTMTAKSINDPRQTTFLENLAAKFVEASKTGDMTHMQFNEDHPHPFGYNASAFGKYNDLHDTGLFGVIGSVVAGALASAGGQAATVPATAGYNFASSGSNAGGASS